MEIDDIAARMAALGNVTRLRIYRMLVRAGRAGLPVAGIQTRLDIPGSTLSHHLRKLIEVGLLSQTRQATTLICHANFDRMKSTFTIFLQECCADEQATHSSNTEIPIARESKETPCPKTPSPLSVRDTELSPKPG